MQHQEASPASVNPLTIHGSLLTDYRRFTFRDIDEDRLNYFTKMLVSSSW